MKKIFVVVSFLAFITGSAKAQDDVYPARNEKAHFFILNGTIHVGNGQVINNGSIEINDGKIVRVGENLAAPQGVKTIDAKGKQVYPGLILSVTDLGLKEIGSGVRGSNDYLEIGDFNPNIRSIVAYNTDSKIINTLRANGILLAGVTPQGGTISGSSSVVQLDAWNWEDAAYKLDNALHLQMPDMMLRPSPGGGSGAAAGSQSSPGEQLKKALDKVSSIKEFFHEAKAYLQQPTHTETNLKYQAVKGLFDRSQKLFVHCDQVKQMLVAIDFVKDFNFDVVIVGGSESWEIADLLRQNNVAVILQNEHSLPGTEDEDIDQPYKTPAMLQKAGVLFALNDQNGETRYRNLPFNAGTAATYGLGKEPALQAITLNAAKILGVAEKTGSLEAGKDANIVISEGDILDMKTSVITYAFIQGRQVDLNNKQKQLNERYRHKYGLKPF